MTGPAVTLTAPAKLTLEAGEHTVVMTSGGSRRQFPINAGGGGDNKWCYDFNTATAHQGSCP